MISCDISISNGYLKKYRLEILQTQDETIVAPTYELELVTIPRLRCDITLCTGSGCLWILRLHGGTRPEILSLATEQTNWILSSSLLSKAELVMGFSARFRRKSFLSNVMSTNSWTSKLDCFNSKRSHASILLNW